MKNSPINLRKRRSEAEKTLETYVIATRMSVFVGDVFVNGKFHPTFTHDSLKIFRYGKS